MDEAMHHWDWRLTAATSLLASGALFAIAFPPFGWVVPAILGLVPFGVTVARQVEQGAPSGRAALFGIAFGLAVYAINTFWIGSAYYRGDGDFALLGYLGALLCVVLPTALASWALSLARRTTRWPLAFLLPVIWVSLEVLLEHLPDVAFPWLPLALALTPHPVLAQVADLSGVHGASFVLAAVAGLLADAWLARRSRRKVMIRLGMTLLVAAAVVAYGAWRLQSVEMRPAMSVLVVQPSIGLAEKHEPTLLESNVGRLVALTRGGAAGDAPDLVVWPETALAGMLGANPAWADSVRVAALAADAPVLFGVVDIERRSDGQVFIYNAAMLTDATGGLGGHPPYRKRALVPVAERFPFVNPAWFSGGEPSLRKGFGRGASDAPFLLEAGAIGTLICFESVFPALARTYRRRGAALLVNITNDAALRGSRGAHQHLAQLSMRAIETRAGVVRAANTGISGYVDPLGRLHGATARDERVAIRYAAQTSSARSPYVVLGDWVGIGCATLAVLLTAWGAGARRRSLPARAQV
jgi:apolipoprotein N-acyltransferase